MTPLNRNNFSTLILQTEISELNSELNYINLTYCHTLKKKCCVGLTQIWVKYGQTQTYG